MARQKPAKFITLSELLASSDPAQEGLQRVIGRLEKYDVKNSLIWLQDSHTPSLQVAVNASSIEPFPGKVGLLYQFIGEVDYRDVPTPSDGATPTGETTPTTVKCPVMEALVHRCMDGLDMSMYLQAHEARMNNLKSPLTPSRSMSSQSQIEKLN